jgi:hypothetical protein
MEAQLCGQGTIKFYKDGVHKMTSIGTCPNYTRTVGLLGLYIESNPSSPHYKTTYYFNAVLECLNGQVYEQTVCVGPDMQVKPCPASPNQPMPNNAVAESHQSFLKENKLGGTCTCKKCGAQAEVMDRRMCEIWISKHNEAQHNKPGNIFHNNNDEPMKRKIAEEKLPCDWPCDCGYTWWGKHKGTKCECCETPDVEVPLPDLGNVYSPQNDKSVKIKESTFIELLEKSVYSAIHGGIIKEALTDSDEKRIGVLARKELKDYEAKLERKVDQMINKAFKGKDFETNTLKITKNAIIQLYKALWIRRSFWTEYIKNTPS